MPSETVCSNINLWVIINQLNRFIGEVQESQSAEMNDWKPYDLNRFTGYMDSLKSFLDWVETQKSLDLPETSPMTIDLDPMTVYKAIENEMIGTAVQYLFAMRDEAIACQSMKQSTGIMEFDMTRFRAIIESLDNYIANYVANHAPMDLPESSPSLGK